MKNKNIIILGAARSGKSTLAKILNEEYNYSVISIDSFVSALRDAFPELGITHSNTENKFKLLPKFVYAYVKKIIKEYPEQKFVLEGWHVYPDDMARLFANDDMKMICLGYIDISCDEALTLIRENENDNSYTKMMNDDEVKKLILSHIEYSRILKKKCESCGVEFWDTSFDRDKKLREIIDNIVK
ncbi:MAG: AAA family ATPase [Clostridia bacterium]|nr:AAA family ATPase [Clostridia bacterium]